MLTGLLALMVAAVASADEPESAERGSAGPPDFGFGSIYQGPQVVLPSEYNMEGLCVDPTTGRLYGVSPTPPTRLLVFDPADGGEPIRRIGDVDLPDLVYGNQGPVSQWISFVDPYARTLYVLVQYNPSTFQPPYLHKLQIPDDGGVPVLVDRQELPIIGAPAPFSGCEVGLGFIDSSYRRAYILSDYDDAIVIDLGQPVDAPSVWRELDDLPVSPQTPLTFYSAVRGAYLPSTGRALLLSYWTLALVEPSAEDGSLRELRRFDLQAPEFFNYPLGCWLLETDQENRLLAIFSDSDQAAVYWSELIVDDETNDVTQTLPRVLAANAAEQPGAAFYYDMQWLPDAERLISRRYLPAGTGEFPRLTQISSHRWDRAAGNFPIENTVGIIGEDVNSGPGEFIFHAIDPVRQRYFAANPNRAGIQGTSVRAQLAQFDLNESTGEIELADEWFSDRAIYGMAPVRPLGMDGELAFVSNGRSPAWLVHEALGAGDAPIQELRLDPFEGGVVPTVLGFDPAGTAAWIRTGSLNDYDWEVWSPPTAASPAAQLDVRPMLDTGYRTMDKVIYEPSFDRLYVSGQRGSSRWVGDAEVADTATLPTLFTSVQITTTINDRVDLIAVDATRRRMICIDLSGNGTAPEIVVVELAADGSVDQVLQRRAVEPSPTDPLRTYHGATYDAATGRLHVVMRHPSTTHPSPTPARLWIFPFLFSEAGQFGAGAAYNSTNVSQGIPGSLLFVAARNQLLMLFGNVLHGWDLGDGPGAPVHTTQLSILRLPAAGVPGGPRLATSVDPDNFYLYGAASTPNSILPFSIGHSTVLHAERWEVGWPRWFEGLSWKSAATGGNLRMGLYADAESPTLIWRSPVVANDVAPDEDIFIPTAAGTPGGLYLEPGDYWVVWYLDSDEGAPAYVGMNGTRHTHFVAPHNGGELPDVIDVAKRAHTTADWSIYNASTPYPTRTAIMLR